MNYRVVGKYLSYLLFALAGFLLPCVLVGLLYGEVRPSFSLLSTSAFSALLALLLFLPCHKCDSPIYARESFVVAGGGWVLISLLGALPFWLSGEIPNFVDALFESASGFTTTGASILSDVEALSHAMLFWRSFTHWLGGIGVLVFVLVVVRAKSGTGFTMHLLRAESTGPQIGKLLPKTRDSVAVLYSIYLGLSLVNLMFLLVGGMPLFDALCTMFGTAGTGGFGVKNDSMASYSPYLQNVTTIFMLLFGVNFALYYFLLRREWKLALKNEELRLYLGIFLGSTAVLTVILASTNLTPLSVNLENSAFAVSSIMTTTGFATVDFNLWPESCRALLLVLMLCGCMAGSTGGGVKTARLLLLFKSVRAGLHGLLHPHSVKAVLVNGHKVDSQVLNSCYLYFSVYGAIAILTFFALSFDGFSLETNLSATLACLNNIGPGLDLVGPTANYGAFSLGSKLLLSLVMLLGRLEIFPLLMLFLPQTWRR